MVTVFAIAAVCLSPPVPGPVIADYAPQGQYEGHWGVDYEATPGEMVRSPASGRVTFAGSVAGMLTVTVEPVPGLKASVSYLADVAVRTGQSVARGEILGTTGTPHGLPGVHFSTRIDGQYVNPMSQLGCHDTEITRALRLVTPPQPYPRSRAHRNPGRDIRPDPYRSSPHRRAAPGTSSGSIGCWWSPPVSPGRRQSGS